MDIHVVRRHDSEYVSVQLRTLQVVGADDAEHVGEVTLHEKLKIWIGQYQVSQGQGVVEFDDDSQDDIGGERQEDGEFIGVHVDLVSNLTMDEKEERRGGG